MLTTTMTKLNRMIEDANEQDDYSRQNALWTLIEDLQETANDAGFQIQMASNTDFAIASLRALCEVSIVDLYPPDLAVFHVATLGMTITNDIQNFMFKNASN